MTSIAAVAAAASAMSSSFCSGGAIGLKAAAEARPAGMERVGTTRTSLPVAPAARSAAGSTLGWFGRSTTAGDGAASTASTRSPTEGFRPGPPLTTTAPSERKIRASPSPSATATIAVA